MEELISLYTNQMKRLPPPPSLTPPPPQTTTPAPPTTQPPAALYICHVYMFRLKFLQTICLE